MRSAVSIPPFGVPGETSSFSFTEDNPDEQSLAWRQHEWEGTTSVASLAHYERGRATTSEYSYFITRILGEATPKQARILGEGVTSNKMERVLYGKHV